MEGRRAPQGLEVEDKLAFGLGAAHLAYVVLGVLGAYATWGTTLPAWFRYPAGAVLAVVGAALGWGRLAYRPLDRWVWLAARYWLRPRRSALRLVAEPTVEAAGDGHRRDPRPGPPRRRPMRRVAFYSLKGGVGKTTLAAETAAALCRRGVAAAVVDLDLLNPCLSTRVGVTDPTLVDAIQAPASEPVAAFMTMAEDTGVRLLLGGQGPLTSGPERRLALDRAAEALEHLEATGCEVAVLDLGREPDLVTRALLELADVIHCVVTPAPCAVHAGYRVVALLAGLGLRDRARLVLNQAGAETDLEEMVADLGLPLAAEVPWAAELAEAELAHRPAAATARALTAPAFDALALASLPPRDEGRRLGSPA